MVANGESERHSWMRETLDKAYESALVEQQWYPYWEREGYFLADSASGKPRFSIVIPPPNVTGSLHMGHALEHTLHDVLVRWKRMHGMNTLWLPGTDHASIAVHYVLDKQLASAQKTRFDLGREKFLELAWKWKQESGNTILNQMRRMGVSCDWSRERFTMDPGLSHAVREVFVRLYEEGLIYRGEYMVNWCPRCNTAISDLEVTYEVTQGKLWHIKYPFMGEDDSVVVATTRPETMLGDTAVAVHPDDDRFNSLIGKRVLLPRMNREIPVIGDTFVDREFGTGVVKVTPAHDPNDYAVAQRHQLPVLTVIDGSGSMTSEAGPYAGLDRLECRSQLVEWLRDEGYLLKEEDHEHNVGYCTRCAAPIEPRVSLQWYLRIKPLAQPAIEAVERGEIQFVPESYTQRYFEWMHNIHDWCISRQLWWGHRIPAWHCDACRTVIVSRNEVSDCDRCKGPLRPETDILDTWFSSALWPFSTLGWPEKTKDLDAFYPTNTLITGPDIIFFWVARMIMMGLKYMGEVPFKTVHIHGIVRDSNRKKMSKTMGNIIEPLALVDEYGADAVRFTLASMAAPGADIPFSTERMKGYRAFANKIWNAARFVLMNLPAEVEPATGEGVRRLLSERRSSVPLEDRWILHQLNQLVSKVDTELEKFRFHDASSLVYQFLWHEFCDWYIEIIKPFLASTDRDPEQKRPRITTLVYLLDSTLRVLHPFMPFITEEIWQKIPHRGESIMQQPFPRFDAAFEDFSASAEMEVVMGLVTGLRALRSEVSMNPRLRLQAYTIPSDGSTGSLIEANLEKIQHLAQLSALDCVQSFPSGVRLLRGVSGAGEFGLDLADAINWSEERDRLEKEQNKLEAEIDKIRKKTENEDFLTRAPANVIEQNRSRQNELGERLEKITAYLHQISEH